MTVSTYLLHVGLGYRIEGILDNLLVEELALIKSDLGRLRGPLKLWLTDDPRTAEVGEATIRAENNQAEMLKEIRCVLCLDLKH